MTPEFASTINKIERNLSVVIRGMPESIRQLLICILAGGHALLEDAPGTGKTTLAKSLARSIDGVFKRIQFTPDLLPADITGSSFYAQGAGRFEFRPGPVFSNVLLADEINRTSPRTQSALLEVMSENQVTVEGVRRDLPRPFIVVATQNPVEFHGTYPLPEAQLDRFTMRLGLGYPGVEHELEILYGHNDHHPLEDLKPVVTCSEVIGIQDDVKKVKVDRAAAEYMIRLAHASRNDPRLRLGISPRGCLLLYRTAQARAAVDGRDFVIPEDIRALAVPVLAHRLMLDTKARYSGASPQTIIMEFLDTVAVPR